MISKSELTNALRKTQEQATPEERARMSPEMSAALDGKGEKWQRTVAKGMLDYIRRTAAEATLSESEPPQAATALALERKEQEEPKGRKAKGKKNVPVPTDVARCSFFFPLRNRDLKTRIYLRNVLVSFSKWGQVYLSGPQMSTQDEDVLLALIAVMREHPEHVRTNFRVDEEGATIQEEEWYFKDIYDALPKTISYYGPIRPIAQKLGYKNPGKNEQKRVIETLELLQGFVVKEFDIADGKKGFRRVKMTHLVENVFWDKAEEKLLVILTPLFYKAFIADKSVKVSMLDIQTRFALSGEIAKALHRFMSSHSGALTCHFSKVAEAINMNTEQPAKEQRRLLKKAVDELIKHGFLAKGSGFVDTDTLALIRVKKIA